jgi:hypothetical protein
MNGVISEADIWNKTVNKWILSPHQASADCSVVLQQGILEGAIENYNWDKKWLYISVYEIAVIKLYMSNDSYKYYYRWYIIYFVQYLVAS